jgi:thiol-disulfide isomerase/thioredoxin
MSMTENDSDRGPMRARPLVRVAALTVIIAAVLFAAAHYTRKFDQTPDAPPGERQTLRFLKNPAAVRAFTARDLDGNRIDSASLGGKVVLVNFWATWCPPCRAEIPDLVALQEKYRDQLQIIGVLQEEIPVERVRSFAAEFKINYPIVMLTPEIEQIFPHVFALPTTFVIDHEMKMVQKHFGQIKLSMIELETRSLAGLDVNADVEQVDADQPIKLENPAQVTSIPGVDLSKLTAAQRLEALEKLNAESCTCGCMLSVAKCRIDDPNCTFSLPRAQAIVAEIANR